jgi:hypothetical protein
MLYFAKNQPMPDIIELVNKIGEPVEQSLSKDAPSELFKYTVLLYSLTENFLKFIVATKISWDESNKQVENETYPVDFGVIRKKAKEATFAKTIKKAEHLKLITPHVRKRLDVREERNDFIHELYLYQNIHDLDTQRKNLLEIRAIMMELVPIFETLQFEEIGVDIPEVFETL